MLPRTADREAIFAQIEALGGATDANIRTVSKSTGVPEADIHGVVSFYHLLARPNIERRVCQGLTCWIAGADDVIAQMRAAGHSVDAVSCLGQCDRPVPILDKGHELVDPRQRGAVTPDDPDLPMNLGGADDDRYLALAKAREMGPDAIIEAIDASGLQGRGGAGFPAAFKWRAVRNQTETERYLVCNADEGEPGTFKDREVMLLRPHLMLEGLAIAAVAVQAQEIIIYIRGEFGACKRALQGALAKAGDALDGLTYRFAEGHGAYICGEETALLEALEGRRGMPRLKPPYPTEHGFRGKPTLMNNVETLACVPSIILRGGQWFRDQGRTEAGSKLYCISGHIERPGIYELPLGATLDELVDAAGGYVGTPLAFSPGGASSGFLPMKYRDVPLDFGGLVKIGSMLGSAGVVVLNDTVDLASAALSQAIFFEDESCGQCTPCRVGARHLRRMLESYLASGDPGELIHIDDLAWEMREGSICGLGIAAPDPIASAMVHFPEAFGRRAPAAETST